MQPIFSIGAGKRIQAAQREDGQWFVRYRNDRTRLWTKWGETTQRPANAWYNPAAGKAKLPESKK